MDACLAGADVLSADPRRCKLSRNDAFQAWMARREVLLLAAA